MFKVFLRAVREKNITLIGAFISNDLLNTQDSRGWTCLHWAACKGFYRDVIPYLVENKAYGVPDNKGMYPAMIAVIHGHPKTVKKIA